MLPEHDLLVVDEAHELVDRVTGVATAELSAAALGVAQRRVGRLVDSELVDRFEAATATFTSAIHDAEPGRMDRLDDEMATYLTALRDAADKVRSGIDTSPTDPKAAAARTEAVTALTEISDTASRILSSFGPAIPDRTDVVWLDHEDNRGNVRAVLRVAPLSVANLLRARIFDQSTVILTSATLTVGGTFDAMARSWGLTGDDEKPGWRGIDVGSPFAHAKSGILYVAAHLPPPGRDGAGIHRTTRRDRGPDHRGRWPHARPVLVDARGQGRRRGDARPPRHPRAVPGRGHHVGIGPPVRRGSGGRRCSARCRCGRASTCPARRCRSC